jgi:hypothetical protein
MRTSHLQSTTTRTGSASTTFATRTRPNYFVAEHQSKTVGTRLGHAQTTMTIDTYGHLMDGDDEKAAETTQEIYGKVGKKKGSNKVA